MKVLVTFMNKDGSFDQVGMNNCLIINDDRIKTAKGLRKRVHDLVINYHRYRVGTIYRITNFNGDELVTQGMIAGEPCTN